MDCQMNTVLLDKSLCKNRKLDPISKHNGDTMTGLDHGTGPIQYPTKPNTCCNTRERGERIKQQEKIGSSHLRWYCLTSGDSWPQSSQPSPCLRLEIPMKSETLSSSISASMTTSCMKSSDLKISNSCTSVSRDSTGSTHCDSLDSCTTASIKRHTGSDSCWKAIQLVNSKDPPLGLDHFKLLKRLGYGDIGGVYLAELKDTSTYFAMKVMDKASLISRVEAIYTLSGRSSPTNISASRLHGVACTRVLAHAWVIHGDLKPENVLVREEGHIMLSVFDLSLQCSVNPTLIKSSSTHAGIGESMLDSEHAVQGCVQPTAFFPRILPKRNRKSKSDFGLEKEALPELMAEPTNACSMSFIGTHEYLAPEIIRGQGHGSAVDWWTFGIFLYELMHGTAPFKGPGNRDTLSNVVGQPLKFPEVPVVSSTSRDLIRSLLVKDPEKRIAYRRGATEINQHSFFVGVNWALVRSSTPPHTAEPVDSAQFARKEVHNPRKKVTEKSITGNDVSKVNTKYFSHLDFEYFLSNF